MPDNVDRRSVQREEAIAVATELARPPTDLVGIKMSDLDGGGGLPDGDPPTLPGFDSPKRFMFDYPYPGGGSTTRPAVRYDSAEGSLIIVAHESGAAIWSIVEGAATVVGLLGGIAGLTDWVRSHHGGSREDPAKFTVDNDGGIVDWATWDEGSL